MNYRYHHGDENNKKLFGSITFLYLETDRNRNRYREHHFYRYVSGD